MTDLAVAIGLVLVIEGLLWAVAPGVALSMLSRAAQTPEKSLRLGGGCHWFCHCLADPGMSSF
ncbi:protein of unknown function [Candidatus Filomicrobium marinum]|uniref:Uncharacterized protein n=1 Tax=Candidatus Filomicrobium marinum TaxID=1608628 RepID=A0A0D6JKT4_9HYPH|nr:DUF2065 domain-containing protein [Candidatus Filomicrobium marinum]CFX64107.1 protein of unknown function [Candidatus Filomicrobium marinum]CPR22579.1 protein of unknown function [Candidatus Filomicrobium marinum]